MQLPLCAYGVRVRVSVLHCGIHALVPALPRNGHDARRMQQLERLLLRDFLHAMHGMAAARTSAARYATRTLPSATCFTFSHHVATRLRNMELQQPP